MVTGGIGTNLFCLKRVFTGKKGYLYNRTNIDVRID